MIPYGPYHLHRRLAVGGMAEVFLATRGDRTDEPLVVKRILPHLESRTDFVHMFLDEARLCSRLFHPNLVRIHDFGRADGVHFIAMDYVDGISLSRILKHLPAQRMNDTLSCWIVAEACAGLAYAHQLQDVSGRPLGIVHRDISPDNILLERSGAVKLTDFGIAKAEARLTQTRPGQIKGKLAYMSPEQAMGAPIDNRCDLFAIGLVLYEITTGQRVFGSPNDAGVLRALVRHEYTSPRYVVPDYSPALADVVDHALAWDPADRYQLASDMRHALQRLIPEDADPAFELAQLIAAVSDAAPQTTERAERITKRDNLTQSDTDDGVTAEPPYEPAVIVDSDSLAHADTGDVVGSYDTDPALDTDSGWHETAVFFSPTSSARARRHSSTDDALHTGPHANSTRRLTSLSAEWDQPPLEASNAQLDVMSTHMTDSEALGDTMPVEQQETPFYELHHSTDHIGLDPAALRAIEGFPWGWVVLAVIAASIALLTLILHFV